MNNLPPQLTPQSQSPMQGMQEMMEGYDQSPDEEGEPEKILAHFAPDELTYLDEMQGGILIDPETNLREYTPLDKILRNPKVREQITQAISQKGQQNIQFAEGGQVEEPGRPTDPELEKMRLQGRKGDTELVIITPELLDIFSEWAGREPDINPETGLPEFGFFKSLFRIAAPIVGAIFGGPIGAAVAGGLATKVTGGSWGQALGAAALSGVGAHFAPSIGGMFQSQFPGLSAGLGSATRGLFGQNVGGALGNLFTPSTGGGLISGLSGVGHMIPGGAAQAATQGATQAGLQAAGHTGGGLLSNLLSNPLLPLVGSGLLMARGHRDEQRGLRDYQQALQNNENRQRQDTEAMRERMGFNDRLRPVEPYRRRQIEPNQTREQYLAGVEPRFFENYAQGGAIKGIGKGQQDNIPKDIKEDSYIIDASTVSDIGDGSTDAGFKELDRYFSKFPSHQSNSKENKSKGGFIKAMVSDGEYEIPPEKVTAIGGGSNEKGSKILKKFVEEVRSRKRNSGQKLPPKSKPISGYISKINRSAA